MRRQVAMAVWITFIVSVVWLLPSAGSAQTINACVAKNGNVRIVDTSASCHPQESFVQWNSGLRVYDNNGVVIGPLMSIAAVTFYVDGNGYSAAVGPHGWVPSQVSFYFFNDTCTGDRYVIRSISTAAPPALPVYFFKSLQVFETAPGHYTGFYQVDPPVMRVLPDDPLWRWDPPSSSCLAVSGSGTYWLTGHSSVELPEHPAPFTIR